MTWEAKWVYLWWVAPGQPGATAITHTEAPGTQFKSIMNFRKSILTVFFSSELTNIQNAFAEKHN